MAPEKLSANKSDDYFKVARDDIIALVPPGAKRVLDVGCGAGETSARLKTFHAVQEVVGIEFIPKVAKIAEQRIDRVLVGDVETLLLDFPNGYFDCIMCADVLEHCKDPWNVLVKLRPFLCDNGVLIASIPNLRHLVVVLKIIFDRWEYESSGILDDGHLRFFTFHTIKNMLNKAGFVIVKVNVNRSVSWKFKLLNFCSFGLLRPFSIYQYLIVARKSHSLF